MHRLAILFLIIVIATPAHAEQSDIDGDGIPDALEDRNGNGIVDSGETDWKNADTDGGGEADGSEVRHGRNPFDASDDLTADPDGDGLSNREEVMKGTNPRLADTDGDGANDREDAFPLEAAYKRDADRDGIADEWEEQYQLSPLDPKDAVENRDTDGLTALQEFLLGTSPLEADTDRDGTIDGIEATQGSDPQESGCLSMSEEPVSFPDMENHWAKAMTILLSSTLVEPLHERIVQGYPDPSGTARLFLPDRSISRFELLKIGLLSTCTHLLGESELPSITFTDVPKQARPFESTEYKLWRRIIYTAARYGIVEGYPDGTFLPDAPVTRAEALAMLIRAARAQELPSETMNIHFSDVPENTWFAPWVRIGLNLALIDGYDDGSFRPHLAITRAEAAKVTYVLMLGNPNVNSYVLPAQESF
jgi:hypothetical protein